MRKDFASFQVKAIHQFDANCYGVPSCCITMTNGCVVEFHEAYEDHFVFRGKKYLYPKGVVVKPSAKCLHTDWATGKKIYEDDTATGVVQSATMKKTFDSKGVEISFGGVSVHIPFKNTAVSLVM